MEKISPKPLQGSDVGDKPKFAFELAAVSPLQLTLTKTSLQLFKTLVDVRNPNHNYISCLHTRHKYMIIVACASLLTMYS